MTVVSPELVLTVLYRVFSTVHFTNLMSTRNGTRRPSQRLGKFAGGSGGAESYGSTTTHTTCTPHLQTTTTTTTTTIIITTTNINEHHSPQAVLFLLVSFQMMFGLASLDGQGPGQIGDPFQYPCPCQSCATFPSLKRPLTTIHSHLRREGTDGQHLMACPCNACNGLKPLTTYQTVRRHIAV